MLVASPCPARPGLIEYILRGAGQVALKILRRVHRVDGVVDFFGDRERVNIHRDREVQEAQVCETLNNSWIGCARPASQDDERVIVTIEKETEIALPAALAVPAVFLNGKFGSESVRRVVV